MILPQSYSIQLVQSILKLTISYDRVAVEKSHIALQTFLMQAKLDIYGFNVIVGQKSLVPIQNLNDYEDNQLRQLLESDSNEKLDPELARVTLFVLINNLVQESGISPLTLDQLVHLYNSGCALSLPSTGYNTQYYDGSVNWAIMSYIKQFQPYDKIIITQMKSLSFATLLYYTYKSLRCVQMCLIITSISFEASNGVICAFTPLVNEVKQHEGQQEVAEELYNLLTVDDEESDLNLSLKRVTHNILQDAYSTRCIPQVVGACLDQIKFAKQKIEQDVAINQRAYQLSFSVDGAITDIIITQQNNNEAELLLIDYLAIAVSEMGAITERRIQRLMNPKLTKLQDYYHEYLRDENSLFGFQHLANQASNLIQKNKKYCHPVSGDSMPQTTHLEDINTNFEDSILKMHQILGNSIHIMAIDLFISSKIIVQLEAKEGQNTHKKLQQIVQEILPLNVKQVITWLDCFVNIKLNE